MYLIDPRYFKHNNVIWYSQCYMCSAPLDFVANIPDDKLDALYTYAKFNDCGN